MLLSERGATAEHADRTSAPEWAGGTLGGSRNGPSRPDRPDTTLAPVAPAAPAGATWSNGPIGGWAAPIGSARRAAANASLAAVAIVARVSAAGSACTWATTI